MNKTPESETAAAKDDQRPAALDNPYIMLAILFLALGAVGLPMLKRSKAFSESTKKWLVPWVILYTVLVIALLIAVIIGFLIFLVWAFTI